MTVGSRACVMRIPTTVAAGYTYNQGLRVNGRLSLKKLPIPVLMISVKSKIPKAYTGCPKKTDKRCINAISTSINPPPIKEKYKALGQDIAVGTSCWMFFARLFAH